MQNQQKKRGAQMKAGIKLFCLFLASVSLTACSKDNNIKDLKAYVTQIEARPAQKIPSVPPLVWPEPFKLPATLKRDPFAPYLNPATLASRPDAGRQAEPLEQFPLDALKMVGTVQQNDVMWALIQSPQGIARVKVGQFIGQNAGEIVKIGTTSLTVRELLPEGLGRWGKRMIEINLNGKS